MIDCYALADRERENMLLYTSPILPAKKHRLFIRPRINVFSPKRKRKRMRSKAKITCFGFSLDRVKIMDGKADLKSEPIIITVKPVTDKLVPLP